MIRRWGMSVGTIVCLAAIVFIMRSAAMHRYMAERLSDDVLVWIYCRSRPTSDVVKALGTDVIAQELLRRYWSEAISLQGHAQLLDAVGFPEAYFDVVTITAPNGLVSARVQETRSLPQWVFAASHSRELRFEFCDRPGAIAAVEASSANTGAPTGLPDWPQVPEPMAWMVEVPLDGVGGLCTSCRVKLLDGEQLILEREIPVRTGTGSGAP